MKTLFTTLTAILALPVMAMECTDFTGKWKGECSVGAQKVEMKIEIEQKDCTKVKMTNDKGGAVEFLVNEIMAGQAGDAKTATVQLYVPEWNDKKEALKITTYVLTKDKSKNTHTMESGDMRFSKPSADSLVFETKSSAMALRCELTK
jgi:hypothetical protein